MVSRGVPPLLKFRMFKRDEICFVVVGGESNRGETVFITTSSCIALVGVGFWPLLSRAEDLVATDALDGCDVDDPGPLSSRRRFADVLGSDRIGGREGDGSGEVSATGSTKPNESSATS